MIGLFQQLEASREPCLLLYSGGLDSSHFLLWAAERGIRTTALYVHLDSEPPNPAIKTTALALGAEFVMVDAVDRFVERFLAPAIRLGSRYWHQFPLSASLSRPLMAEIAVEVALQSNIRQVVHCSTPSQNSAVRLNRSIKALAPKLHAIYPAADEMPSRSEKARLLSSRQITFRHPDVSWDENLWAHCMEGGILDNLEAPLTPQTLDIRPQTPSPIAPSIRIDIGFSRGLPTSLDGEVIPLKQLITKLRGIGRSYNLGLYDGFEQNPEFIALREVRLAPAASIILCARDYLDALAFDETELRVRSALSSEWSSLIVSGHWHSLLSKSIIRFAEDHDSGIDATTHVRISERVCSVESVSGPLSQRYTLRSRMRY